MEIAFAALVCWMVWQVMKILYWLGRYVPSVIGGPTGLSIGFMIPLVAPYVQYVRGVRGFQVELFPDWGFFWLMAGVCMWADAHGRWVLDNWRVGKGLAVLETVLNHPTGK